MKISKLAIVTGLTSAIALGAFIESADAQALRTRTGHTYSPTANDETTVTNQFTVVDTLPDGTVISDQASSNLNVGLFVGAIEDYAVVQGNVDICGDRANCPESSFNSDTTYLYDSLGYPIFARPVETITKPFDGDLLVEFFAPGEDALFKNSNESTFGYTIVNPETSLPVSTYRLTLGNIGTGNFNQDEAVNSLSYILDNNLLGKSSRVIFTPKGQSFTGESVRYIYPTDVSATVPGIGGLGSVLLQNKFEQDISTTPVPESGTILGTLAALVTGALIKRMKQH